MEQYSDHHDYLADYLSVLANSRRRILIRYLQDDDHVPLAELATTIAQVEHDSPTRQDTQSIQTALRDTHAPTLDACGVIQYNDRQKTISRGPHYQTVYELLVAVEDALSE